MFQAEAACTNIVVFDLNPIPTALDTSTLIITPMVHDSEWLYSEQAKLNLMPLFNAPSET